jgi:predicted Fe-Mo cluster-binding NifX family protein
MKIAIAQWRDRISPVFDVSDRLVLIDIENGIERHREDIVLTCRGPFERTGEVLRLGVQVLICGAVSRPLETALISAGVRVIGFICGGLEDVIGAYLKGTLSNKRFQMPGCERLLTQPKIVGQKNFDIARNQRGDFRQRQQ